MKKLSTIILALALALITVCACAETYSDMSEVTIYHSFTNVNPGSASPEQTFTFTIQGKSVTDAAEGITLENMPMPTVGSVHYAAGEAGTDDEMKEITITLPEYPSVGIYTYSIRGVAGNDAGVNYYTNEMRLVVTVIEQNGKIRVAAVHTETSAGPLGGGKSDMITTTYRAGKLAVSKSVTGNLGDRNRYFDIHVTLVGEQDKTYAESYPVTGGSHEDNPDRIVIGEETTFRIRDDETITIANLPYGVTYEVTEADYSSDGYETTVTCSDEHCVVNSASDTVSITNHKESAIDTGISTDTLPYLVLLGIAVVTASAMLIRRRSRKA